MNGLTKFEIATFKYLKELGRTDPRKAKAETIAWVRAAKTITVKHRRMIASHAIRGAFANFPEER